MKIPPEVNLYLRDHGFGKISTVQAAGGGCINNGAHLKTSSGEVLFLKTNYRTPADMFAREAEGLNALRVEHGPHVPKVLQYAENFILLEDLNPAARCADYWSRFGHQLASLHRHTNTQFGFQNDNYIGSTPQLNTWSSDGYEFFGQHRLLFQSQLANRRGLLGNAEVRQVERLAARLPELVPIQPASLIHGDLWSGNAISDRHGEPAIIDPAAHYGWAEAELAMTTLFGSFPDSFYRAYQEVRPLEANFRKRFPLYNLYHLLNHLNLFGGSYLGQVTTILRRYGS